MENLRNGIDRPVGDADNGWYAKLGDNATYTFFQSTSISKIRLIFDSDLNRETLPDDELKRNMYANKLLSFEPFYVPKTLVKEFILRFVFSSGAVEDLEITDNIKRLVTIPGKKDVLSVSLIPTETWGSEEAHIFAFDLT